MFAFLGTPTSSLEAVGAKLLRSLSRRRGFLARVDDLSDGTVRVAARPLWFWLPNPDIGVKIVPSVGGTNLHVRSHVRAYWYLLLTVLAGSALLGITKTVAYGSIEAGYRVASTPVVTWHVATLAIFCGVAFFVVVLALLLGLVNARLCVRLACGPDAPPN
jgi:hypothetical protein